MKFQAAEAHSNLDQIKALKRITKLSMEANDEVIKYFSPNSLGSIVDMSVKKSLMQLAHLILELAKE